MDGLIALDTWKVVLITFFAAITCIPCCAYSAGKISGAFKTRSILDICIWIIAFFMSAVYGGFGFVACVLVGLATIAVYEFLSVLWKLFVRIPFNNGKSE
jgi:hypothetical protein